jgi:Arc/MetJ-type ribon-helix-helix transcriptional regulator
LTTPQLPAPNIPDDAEDVTEQFNLSDALPPTRLFATAREVAGRPGRRAEISVHLSKLNDNDAKQGLVNKHVSITKQTDARIHEVVNWTPSGYDSVSDFIRHAIELLVDYYRETKQYPADQLAFAEESILQQHSLSDAVAHAKARQELIDSMRILDQQMEHALDNNDMNHIGKELHRYKVIIDNCDTEVQREAIRAILRSSIATRSCAQSFYKWTHNRYRMDIGHWDDEWPSLSEEWAEFYDESQ